MKEPLAYQAMFRFLDERYRKLPSDELGALLGELQLSADGEPFDPAVTEDWNRAVGTAQQKPELAKGFERQRRAG
jgi:hypothetical protein